MLKNCLTVGQQLNKLLIQLIAFHIPRFRESENPHLPLNKMLILEPDEI